ncbi:MAG TPA: substrate-binding domain-containing protein [Nitrospirota bacterium]|nr:substrate-binding domain-containing protein [Nitrospirota bacterium]
MNRIAIQSILVAALLMVLAAAVQAADIVVIVNKGNGADINRAMIEKIFKGDMSNWPDGSRVEPLDLPESSPDRAAFTSLLYGKSVMNLKAVWQVKLYSGRGVPPREVKSDDEVKSIVAGNQNAIGYIKASSVDGSVKAIMTLR